MQNCSNFHKLRKVFEGVVSWFHEWSANLILTCPALLVCIQMWMRWAETSHWHVLSVSSCQMAGRVGSISSGRGREAEAKSTSKGYILQCTAHGKSSNNPGVIAEPWTPSTAQVVNNDTRTTAHLLCLCGCYSFTYLKWVLSKPMVRPSWSSVHKR